MSGRGGKREGAGRPKGSPNRATAEQKLLFAAKAMELSDLALEALAAVAQGGESEAARVSAATAILDRAFGRPGRMEIEDEPVEDGLVRLIRQIQQRGSKMPIATQKQG
jgi:hypothetical protein